jgi:hypothetical protein
VLSRRRASATERRSASNHRRIPPQQPASDRLGPDLARELEKLGEHSARRVRQPRGQQSHVSPLYRGNKDDARTVHIEALLGDNALGGRKPPVRLPGKLGRSPAIVEVVATSALADEDLPRLAGNERLARLEGRLASVAPGLARRVERKTDPFNRSAAASSGRILTSVRRPSRLKVTSIYAVNRRAQPLLDDHRPEARSLSLERRELGETARFAVADMT